MLNEDYISIQEASIFSGLAISTIYKAITRGILPIEYDITHGKKVKKVRKSDLTRVFNLSNSTVLHDITPDITRYSTIEYDRISDIVQDNIKKVLEEKQSQIMKPMEEQALFVAGKLQAENQFLKEKLDTVLTENEDLKNSMKALPDKSAVEAKDYKILSLEEENENLKKQMELLPGKPEEIKDILLQNAENLKFLQEELSSSTALAEMKIEKLREQAEQEKAEALKAMSLAAEKEKMELIQAWQKKVDEVFERPWWKFW